jgi:RNA polymerase sigma-70 factor (ECF subfamily)
MGSTRAEPSTTPTVPSGELLRRARDGDAGALERLFARYLPALTRWVHGRVPAWARNGADSADFVQDTFLHTVRNLDAFEPQRDGALLAYLRRALLNRVNDQLRRGVRRPASAPLDERLPAGGASPLDSAIAEEDRRRYREALGRLRAADQRAIVASVELGYDYEQLALILKKPSAGAARVAVRRALLRLADEMRRG